MSVVKGWLKNTVSTKYSLQTAGAKPLEYAGWFVSSIPEQIYEHGHRPTGFEQPGNKLKPCALLNSIAEILSRCINQLISLWPGFGAENSK